MTQETKDEAKRSPFGELAYFQMRVLRHRPKSFLLIILLSFLASVTEGISIVLIIPFLELQGISEQASRITQVITSLTPDSFEALTQNAQLYVLLSILVLMSVLRAFLFYAQQLFQQDYGLTFTNSWRRSLGDAISRSKWKSIISQSQNSIEHLFSVDAARLTDGATSFISLWVSLILVTVQLGFALFVSAKTAILALGFAAIFVVLVRPFYKRSIKIGQQISERSEDVFLTSSQLMDGLKQARVARTATLFLQNFYKQIDEERKVYLSGVRIFSALSGIFSVGMTIYIAVLVVISLVHWELPISTLTVILLILLRIFGPLRRIFQIISYVISISAVLRRIDRRIGRLSLSESVSLPIKEHKNKNVLLKLDQISFGFDEEKRLYENVSMDVEQGEMAFILGPSGSGKTTLLDIISGLYEPSHGDVSFASSSTRIHYLVQHAVFFEETIREFLLRGSDAISSSEDDIFDVLATVQLKDRVQGLEHGLDTILNGQANLLSGGERQRLALAAALLKDVDLILADEATSAMDAKVEAKIFKALASTKRQQTLVFVTHNRSLTRFADRVIDLEEFHAKG